MDGNLHINQRALTVTATSQSKTYGDVFTPDGASQFGTEQGQLVNGDTVDRVTLTSAGYVGTATFTSPGPDYAITPSDAQGAKLGNYAVTYVDDAIHLNQRPITVTADAGQHKTYGDAEPALTYSISAGNLVNGDSFSGDLHRAEGENAGEYEIDQGMLTAGGNYALTYEGDVFTILKAYAVIVVTPYDVTYDGQFHTATASVTGVHGELLDGLDLNDTIHKDAGTYTDSWEFTDVTGNYHDAAGSVVDVIRKKHLTVTADAKTRVFGNPNPVLTATLSGFVSGEGPSVVSGLPTLATTATVHGPVETYPITVVDAGTLSAANYDFPSDLFVSGILTITLPSGSTAYVLNASASGALTASGNATAQWSGGLHVGSNSASAVVASGNAMINVGGAVLVTGGVKRSGNAQVTKTGTPLTTSDPLSTLALPSVSGLTSFGAVGVAGNSVRTLNPGIYSSIQVSGNARVTLNPGTYIIKGGGLSVSGNGRLTGNGVFIFNAGTAFNGTTDGGAYGSVSIGGNGVVNLSAANSGPYAGIVLFQSRTNTRALALSGNGNVLTGVVYAPSANAGVSCNGRVTGTLVTSSLTLTGNAGAFQLAAGATTEYVVSASNWISNGTLTVSAHDAAGHSLGAAMTARLGDAMTYLNDSLGSFGVNLTWAAPGTAADVQVNLVPSTTEGGVNESVFVFTTADHQIYIVAGWDYYTGLDPVGIGADQFDFLSLATHELAHAVGLGESGDASSVLNMHLAPGLVRRTISDFDLASINTNALFTDSNLAHRAEGRVVANNPHFAGKTGVEIAVQSGHGAKDAALAAILQDWNSNQQSNRSTNFTDPARAVGAGPSADAGAALFATEDNIARQPGLPELDLVFAHQVADSADLLNSLTDGSANKLWNDIEL